MKKSITLLLFLSILVFFSSCENKNKGIPVREELLSMSLEEQVNMLQSSSPDVVYQYYKLKLDNTLKSKNLTDKEKAVIRPLKDMLSVECFSDPESEEDRELILMIESIEKTLVEDFGWDEKKLYKYFETIMTEEEFDLYVKRQNIDW